MAVLRTGVVVLRRDSVWWYSGLGVVVLMVIFMILMAEKLHSKISKGRGNQVQVSKGPLP